MTHDSRHTVAFVRSLRRLGAGLVVALCGFGCGSHSALAQPAGPSAMASQLVTEFRRAHEAKDVDAALRLVHWDRAEAATKDTFRANFKDDFAMTIDKVEVAPTPPGQVTRYTRHGKTYQPNLDVRKVLVVRFKPQAGQVQVNSTTYLIGEKDGRYYITPAVPAP